MARLALRLSDAEAAARLGTLPGMSMVEDPAEADLLITDAATLEPGGPPALVLAEGAAALQALRSGARGVLPPDAGPAEAAAALAALGRGLAVLPARLLAGLLRPASGSAPGPAGGLTPREREVLDLLAAGASNKVIARRLGLSFHTAKAHVASVLQKLGASSRADAVARGARAGLVLL